MGLMDRREEAHEWLSLPYVGANPTGGCEGSSKNSPETIALTNGRPRLSVVDAPRARCVLER